MCPQRRLVSVQQQGVDQLRVLHVIPSVSSVHGGPSKAIVAMERALVERGISVTTVTTDDDGPGRRRADSSQPAAVPGARRFYFRKWLEFYKIAPGLQFWLWRNIGQFDVVHIHALFSFSSIVGAWAAHRAGVPYVIRPLGTLNHYGVTQRRPCLKRLSLALLELPALRRAAAVHFTSDDEQREAQQSEAHMRGVVIPLGIDAADVSKATPAKISALGLGNSAYILFVGRLNPVKNVEGLLRAFREIVAKWPTLFLLIAGDGAPDYVAELKGLAHSLALDEQVVWAGHVDDEAKGTLLAGASAFVLPSFSENFGIAAAEALMAGLPCVLGHGVAIAQDVVDAGAGVAVSPDPASIAAGLMQMMADAEMRASMSERAVALAHDKYSAQAMGANLVALYEDILGPRQAKASEMAEVTK